MIQSLRFRRIAVLAFYGLIIFGSSIPGKSMPGFFKFTPDKLLHCMEYFCFGLVLLRWSSIEYQSQRRLRIYLIALIVGLAGAMIDENYQRLTPGRMPDFYDWCLDSVGLLVSIGLFHLYSNWKEKGSIL